MKKINGVGQTKDGIDLYSKTDFLGMHKAGMLAAQILDEIGEFVYPGQSTEKIDEIIEDKGVKVFVDSAAIMYLLGTEMDYKKEELSSSFVFNNPNETERCGCGESFKIS